MTASNKCDIRVPFEMIVDFAHHSIWSVDIVGNERFFFVIFKSFICFFDGIKMHLDDLMGEIECNWIF